MIDGYNTVIDSLSFMIIFIFNYYLINDVLFI